MTALTYKEAQERSRLIDVLEYRVELDVTGGDDVFGSVTVVRFCCRAPGADSFVEIRPARLRRVVLNGQDVNPATLTGNRLPLADLRAVNELRVEADMPYSRTGAGLHRFTDAADGETYLALHGGLDHAQRVMAAFDQPDLKAVITAAVTAPASWTVIGNALARPAGDGQWELAATPPISTYLFTVVAGPYCSIRAEHHDIPFALHARQSLAGHLHRDAAEILAITRACFDRYREIFAEPYPYDSYDQVFVPELESGAVENPGCVTFRDEFLFPATVTRAERQTRGMVIAHEMAHMWFGDLVTMRWWNDVWLSESFATYMGFRVLAEATAFTGTWTDFALAQKTRGYDADQRESTHPVAPEPRDVPDTDAALASYDDISYAKGASALRQLVDWLGWPAFLAGINDYFARYRFGSATLADLLDCLTRASGANVGEWAGHWLRSSGVDTLTVARPEAPGRVGCVSHTGGRPHRVRVGVYDEEPGQLTLRTRIPVPVPADAGMVVLPSAAVRPEPALLLPNDGDFSYCKVRLDPASQAALDRSLGRLADPLSRAVAWNSLRDLVRDGELAPRQYLGLAARHLPAETDSSIAGHVIAYARWTVTDRYLPPGLRGAATGGHHQLVPGSAEPASRRGCRRDAAGRRARPDRQRIQPGRHRRPAVLAGRRAGARRTGHRFAAPLADPAAADGARCRQPGRDRARRQPGRHRGRAAQRGALPGRTARPGRQAGRLDGHAGRDVVRLRAGRDRAGVLAGRPGRIAGRVCAALLHRPGRGRRGRWGGGGPGAVPARLPAARRGGGHAAGG